MNLKAKESFIEEGGTVGWQQLWRARETLIPNFQPEGQRICEREPLSLENDTREAGISGETKVLVDREDRENI